MSIDSDLIRGHVDTIILKTLTDGDKYGYEIIKEITEKSNGSYELKQPTLYSCLKRLENQGLISAYWKNSDIGGKRHYYKLTKKGRNFYESSMNEWFSSRNIIDNLMGSKSVVVPEDEEVITGKSAEPENSQIMSETPSLEPTEEEISETPQESLENKEFAQMVVSDNSYIVQQDEEVMARDFEIEDLTEDDAELLQGYYKTDDDQINFFASNTFNAEENFLDKIIDRKAEESEQEPSINDNLDEDDTEDEEREPSPFFCGTPILEAAYEKYKQENGEPAESEQLEDIQNSDNTFETFDGADLSKYKASTGTNYFDDTIKDDSSYDLYSLKTINDMKEEISHKEQSLFQEKETINNDLEDDNSWDEDTQETESSSPLYSNFSAYNNNNYSEEYNEENDTNNHSSNLNFGYFGEDNEEDEELSLPRYNFSSETIEESNESESLDEDKINSYASLYGSDENEEAESINEEQKPYHELDILDSGDYADYSTMQDDLVEEDWTSNGISKRESINPSYTPKYTEVTDREKLNHLSSYATAPTFDISSIEQYETQNNLDYAELEEELKQDGIKLKPYKKREKDPQSEKNYLLVNKIKFASSWISYAIIALLLVCTYFIAKAVGYLDLSLTTTTLSPIAHFLIAAGIMLIFPGIYTCLFLLGKSKKMKPNYSMVISLIFALLFFIVCINIIYTVNILLGFAKFSQTDYNHLLWLLPSVCSLFIIIQSLVYSALFASKKFTSR